LLNNVDFWLKKSLKHLAYYQIEPLLLLHILRLCKKTSYVDGHLQVCNNSVTFRHSDKQLKKFSLVIQYFELTIHKLCYPIGNLALDRLHVRFNIVLLDFL